MPIEYLLGRESRAITRKNQITIPSKMLQSIRKRNPGHKNQLYLMLAHAPSYRGFIPFVKCFDRTALERKAKGIIPSDQIEGPYYIDRYGRFAVPKKLVKQAELENINDLVIVASIDTNSEWGITFGIYDLDNYHLVQDDRKHGRLVRALEAKAREIDPSYEYKI
jgi:hypothetical protein